MFQGTISAMESHGISMAAIFGGQGLRFIVCYWIFSLAQSSRTRTPISSHDGKGYLRMDTSSTSEQRRLSGSRRRLSWGQAVSSCLCLPFFIPSPPNRVCPEGEKAWAEVAGKNQPDSFARLKVSPPSEIPECPPPHIPEPRRWRPEWKSERR